MSVQDCCYLKEDGTCGDREMVCIEWLQWDKYDRKDGQEDEWFCENLKTPYPDSYMKCDRKNALL